LAVRVETPASMAEGSSTLALPRALATGAEQLDAQLVPVQAMLNGAHDGSTRRIGWGLDEAAEPPAFRPIHSTGKEGLVCAGHAIGVHRQVSGARLLPMRHHGQRGGRRR
jgi:hypothetical protein